MRKRLLIGLLAVAAILALVAGASYAIFSDNVASDDQTFAAGTVDIQVDGEDEYFETTLNMDNMEPGDCDTQDVVVTNVGTLDVNLWNWIYTWGDIFKCDPNPKCNMYVKKTLKADGNAVEENLDANGDTETYTLEACLPLCAGNLCQGDSGKMRMFFHAVQESNLDGWECVKLLAKNPPDWIPEVGPPHGNKCYKVEGGVLKIVVNGYGLTPNMPLQLMLNGTGKCTTTDKLIAGDYDLNGTVDPANWDAYYRGFWNEGGNLSQTCDPAKAGEGVYAFAHGGTWGGKPSDPAAITDGSGNFSGEWHVSLPLDTHCYKAKFLVKQDQSPWLAELDELDYQIFGHCEE